MFLEVGSLKSTWGQGRAPLRAPWEDLLDSLGCRGLQESRALSDLQVHAYPRSVSANSVQPHEP